ncbi:MAG: glycerophosphodiester phosphodiesterase [Spirochaetota bacterium]
MARRALFPGVSRPLIFAHRGYSARAPENTMPAFHRAADAGIPGVELDVHLSRDGIPVVAHDADLLRLAGVDAALGELTAEELARADVGSWFSAEFAGTGVPTLDELFETFKTSFYYDVEIKHSGGDPSALIEAVLSCIDRHALTSHVLISSFHPAVVARVRRAHGLLPAALIFSAHRQVPLALRRGQGRYLSMPDVLKPHWAELLRPSARILGPLDTRPRIVWTVDGAEALDALQGVGASYEGIVSNDPVAAQRRWVGG